MDRRRGSGRTATVGGYLGAVVLIGACSAMLMGDPQERHSIAAAAPAYEAPQAAGRKPRCPQQWYEQASLSTVILDRTERPEQQATQVQARRQREVPDSRRTPMPRDVVEYLRWAKQFDRMRLQLQRDGEERLRQLQAQTIGRPRQQNAQQRQPSGSNIYPAHSGPDHATLAIAQMISRWNGMAVLFEMRRPPKECVGFALAYRDGLKGRLPEMSRSLQIITSAQHASEMGYEVSPEMVEQTRQDQRTGAQSRAVRDAFRRADTALGRARTRFTEVPSEVDQDIFRIVP
jgi:hypothetical protein